MINFVSLSSSEDEEEEIRAIRRRVYRPRINFSLNDSFFKEKFRIYSEAAEFVIHEIAPYLLHDTFRNNALTPQMQLLAALHFVGNGGQYHGIADMHGLSKSTICRCVRRVSEAIVNTLMGRFVKWPENNAENIANLFKNFADFPQVAGIVDGTLIPIDAPSENEPSYVDRKGNHSINAMVVAGPQLQFFYASARWPGSVHDSRVMRNSSLYDVWETEGEILFFAEHNHFLLY